MLKAVPLLVVPLVMYNLFAFLAPALLSAALLNVHLASGANWVFTVNELLLLVSIVLLYVEIVKSTRTTADSIIDHILSLAVYIAFLMEFIFVPQVGDSTFFLMMMVSLLDVISGFTITISTARRDLSMDRQMIR